jgi:hypothetical protein
MIDSVLYMITGAAFYGGAHHLYQGVHNRAGHPHVLHAVMFLLLAQFALFSASTSTVNSLAELAQFSKLSVSFGMLLFATLPWFIARLLQQRSNELMTLLTSVWSALLIINIASPYGLLHKDISTVNPAWHLVEITMLGTLAYSIYLFLQQYRNAGKIVAPAPAAGLFLLLCTTIFDFFVHAGLIQSAYLAPMGFMLFLIATGLQRQSTPATAIPETPEDASRYQVTLNFNQAPMHDLMTTPTGIATDTDQVVETFPETAETVPESPPARLQQDVVETPAVPPFRIDNPTVDLVSDSLVDIAVHATLILKRLEQGEFNALELKELGHKVRTQAIETRRITHQMLREQEPGRKPKAD